MKTTSIFPLSLIALFAIFMTSCVKEPSADFYASTSAATVGESISFTNTSTESESYEWDFGDGTNSTSENPSHSFSNPGSYTVTLTAFSKKEKKEDNATLTVTIEAEDPCANITCLNGGYCANGSCVCHNGYNGSDCSSQVTPSKLILSKIQIIKFPSTDNGAGWDLTSGADIYPELSLGSTIVWSSQTFYENADPSNVYEFDVNPTFDLTSPTSQYSISLYDYDDTSADDFMGGINFSPYSATNGFPSIIELDAGGDVAFRIYVSYAW
jgi:PKD repeat protein